jgi:hypothetical protein
MNKKLLSLVLLMNVYNVWSADFDVYSSGSSSDNSFTDLSSSEEERLRNDPELLKDSLAKGTIIQLQSGELRREPRSVEQEEALLEEKIREINETVDLEKLYEYIDRMKEKRRLEEEPEEQEVEEAK